MMQWQFFFFFLEGKLQQVNSEIFKGIIKANTFFRIHEELVSLETTVKIKSCYK